ncbi:MAG: hypothetical protein OHK0023_11240 [Anaerolineae bacterium]
MNSTENGSRRSAGTGESNRPHLTPPPPPDESYWAALLREGEYTANKPPQDSLSGWGFGLDGDPNASKEDDLVQSEADWELAERTYHEDQAVELPVVGYNRGGLLVEWHSLRGFVPASQLTDFPNIEDGPARRSELAARVGSFLQLRVIELDKTQNRLILSERAAQVRAGARANLLDTLRPGDKIVGRVTNLCDFGAFVDLGGIEGLIHISELSWGRVGHPRDILQRGQTISTYVMEVNRDHGRVALSLKRLQPDPWATVAERYAVGQLVEGVITNVVDFGAFARVEEGLEGLIHVSELAEGNFLHPRNVVREGDWVHARVLNIDGAARRLGLSLRRAGNEVPASTTQTPYSTGRGRSVSSMGGYHSSYHRDEES